MIAIVAADTAYASDYRFKDMGAFTAHGDVTVTAAAVSLPCTASLTGTTTGGARITGATFSGVSCLALTASHLPWRMHANASHGFTIKDVTVEATVLGICGPGKVKAQLNTAGVISFTGAGLPGLVPCSVSGTLKTTPKVMIVAK
jgi:hypothetical protein